MTAVLHQLGDIKLLLHRNFTVFSHKYAMVTIDIEYNKNGSLEIHSCVKYVCSLLNKVVGYLFTVFYH